MAEQVLAVDLGGSTMRAAVVAADGAVLLRHSQPTPREDTCPNALLRLVGGILAERAVRSVVISVPGWIDHVAGALEVAPNLPPHWPEVVVLGGGLGRDPGLLATVQAALAAHGPRSFAPAIEVRTAVLGDDAGLVGAGGWARATAPTPRGGGSS